MPSNADPQRATYAAAGVDIDAGERAVEALRPFAEKATRPEVIGGIGGFAGLFALRLGRYREPMLAASTDGVGTKVAVAQAMDKHDTIGLDLVAMVVDDIVVCGAEPLFLQDYIAVGTLVPDQIAAIVKGIADGLRAGRLRAARRRDRRASRDAGGGQLRPVRDPVSAWSRPTRCSVRTGCGPATWWSRWARPGCTPTAIRWPDTCCWTSLGCRWRGGRGVRPHPGRGAARADPDLRQGLPGDRRRDLGADVRAHHRRWAGAQPGTGDAARAWSRCSTAAPGPRRRCSS